MPRRLLLVLTVLGLVTAGLLVLPAPAGAAPRATSAFGLCPMPPLAQQLAKDAVAIEPTGHGARFYMRPVAMQEFRSLAINTSVTPSANYPGDWKAWGQAWVEWAISTPDCRDPDGYAFAFNTKCYNGSTLVVCNFQGQAGLEYDHAAADWDGLWGYRYYHEFNQTSCTDVGAYHFFSDSAPGRVRTLIRFRVRFVSIDYLTQYRRMTSNLLRIADKVAFPGIDWTTNGAGSAPPGTQSYTTAC